MKAPLGLPPPLASKHPRDRPLSLFSLAFTPLSTEHLRAAHSNALARLALPCLLLVSIIDDDLIFPTHLFLDGNDGRGRFLSTSRLLNKKQLADLDDSYRCLYPRPPPRTSGALDRQRQVLYGVRAPKQTPQYKEGRSTNPHIRSSRAWK